MKILQKYLGQTILQTILLVTFILIGLEFFIFFVSQLDMIGHGGFGLSSAIWYVILTLPQEAYNLFPLAALLGCLLGLGFLSATSELIVMRTSGMSLAQVMGAVLNVAMALVLIVTLIGEVLGPYAMRYAERMKDEAINGGRAVHTAHGVWLKNKNDFIHITKVFSLHELQDVLIYHFGLQHQLLSAAHAQSAHFRHGRWQLENVDTSWIRLEGVTVKHEAIANWQVNMKPQMFSVDLFDPQEMSLVGLHEFIKYRKENGMQANRYELSFWQRIFQPLATAVMMFLAIPFVFGPLRTVTMGLRILFGIIVGFAFHLLNEFLGPLSLVFQLPPVIAAALPPVLFLILGYFLLKKNR